MGVSEEEIKEDEILRKIKKIVKCPYVGSCKVEITQRWFEDFCKGNFMYCKYYDDFAGKKTVIEWLKSSCKSLQENVNTQ